jgi:hypothetical protein
MLVEARRRCHPHVGLQFLSTHRQQRHAAQMV